MYVEIALLHCIGGVWRAKQTSENRSVVFKTAKQTLHARSCVVVKGVQYHLAEDIMAERDILRHLSTQNTVSPLRVIRYIDFLFRSVALCTSDARAKNTHVNQHIWIARNRTAS